MRGSFFLSVTHMVTKASDLLTHAITKGTDLLLSIIQKAVEPSAPVKGPALKQTTGPKKRARRAKR